MNISQLLKREWPQLLLLAVPFAIIAITWGHIPEKIPTHWNFRGEIDSYGSKLTIFILPLINILVVSSLSLIQKFDPRPRGVSRTSQILKVLRLVISTVIFILFLVTVGVLLNR